MHLVGTLASGVRGAENGWAEVYRRGTSTRATWYEDFEGTSAMSTGANVTLDANGGAALYVDELVDVYAKDSSGNLVRYIVAGDAVSAQEVRSQSFTGTDYATGASAARNPTTTQAVLDLWKTNSGAIDWKVLFGGTATTLQTALGQLVGPAIYNVKAYPYSAVGDGTADDTSAIAAAIAAIRKNAV